MKIFVWMNVNTGAYHEDGVIAVMAKDLKEARKIVTSQEEAYKRKTGWDPTYVFSPVVRLRPTRTIKLGVAPLMAKPQIVVSYEGCDC